jgi:hypothetical protein
VVCFEVVAVGGVVVRDVPKQQFHTLTKAALKRNILPNHYIHPGYHEMRTHRRRSVHCYTPLEKEF